MQFNLAIQRAPLNPLPLYYRSIAYTLLGQYGAALSDISMALTGHPDDTHFLLIKANILFVVGHYGEAVSLCDGIIRQGSPDAAAYLIRGNSERLLGDRTAADSDYHTAARLQNRPQYREAARRL